MILIEHHVMVKVNNISRFFRDEIEIFLISLFETRSRFVSSISRVSRRDREFALQDLGFREGGEKQNN